MGRKTPLPKIQVRPEPLTVQQIKEEIKFLEHKLNGELDKAIEARIKVLKKKLESL